MDTSARGINRPANERGVLVRSSSDEQVDAVVIGAGPNGLVAANVMADAGWSVLVCEATDQPGGAVRSGEVTAPGFSTDLGSAFYPLGAASPVLNELGLGEHGLRWRHAPTALAHVTPDDRCVVLSRDLDTTIESVNAFAPADGPVWRELSAEWTRLREDLLETVLRPFPPVRPGLRLARALGVGDGLRFARMVTQSAHRYVEERFAGDGARPEVRHPRSHRTGQRSPASQLSSQPRHPTPNRRPSRLEASGGAPSFFSATCSRSGAGFEDPTSAAAGPIVGQVAGVEHVQEHLHVAQLLGAGQHQPMTALLDRHKRRQVTAPSPPAAPRPSCPAACAPDHLPDARAPHLRWR